MKIIIDTDSPEWPGLMAAASTKANPVRDYLLGLAEDTPDPDPIYEESPDETGISTSNDAIHAPSEPECGGDSDVPGLLRSTEPGGTAPGEPL